jgi:hypothetical protein
MKASSAAVATGCVWFQYKSLTCDFAILTCGFGAFVEAFALKYLLMPLLIFSCLSLSSSRFLLAGGRQ